MRKNSSSFAMFDQSKRRIWMVLSWLVSMMVPIAILVAGIRIIMLPAFLKIEYNLPGFPEDRYGFTLEDRLYWAPIAVEYLLNSEDISFLGDLRFDDGTPVYNERELSHMVDVKVVTNIVMQVWYFVLGGLTVFGIWAWRGNWMGEFRNGVSRGGWITVALVGSMIFFVILSFRVFFVAFHNLFFQPGTWLFYYSDTLIRLFPERFWQDIFIYVGVFSLVVGFVLGMLIKQRK